MRLSRHEMHMEIARLVAKRSTCERGNVGAVIVRGSRIIATGYNGAPSNAPHCTDVGCHIPDPHMGCQRAVHAEANALAWAARQGIATENAYLYSTHAPCIKCAQLIVTAGISHMWFETEYRLQRLDILRESGVGVNQYTHGH